jgi:hypothetical protein
MSQKEINELTQIAQDELKKVSSKEEALKTFVKAGILDAQGNFTETYRSLSEVTIKAKI